MALGELEFVIKVRQDLDRQIAALKGQVAPAAADMGRAFDKTGKSVSGLTQFVREQRQEQRLQNFLFREGTQVMGAASVALTVFGVASADASEKTKQINSSLNQGFIAFQGVSFLLARVNPALGLTVAALAGLGATVLSLKKDADTAKDAIESITKLSEAISKLDPSNVGALTDYYRELVRIQGEAKAAEAVKDVIALNAATTALNATLGRGAGDIGVWLGQLLGVIPATEQTIAAANRLRQIILDPVLVTATTDEKLQSNAVARAKSISELIKLNDETNKSVQGLVPMQTKINQTIFDRIQLFKLLGREEFLRLTDQERELKNAERLAQLQAGVRPVPETRSQSLDTSNLFNDTSQGQLITQLGQLGITAENVNNQIVNSTQGAAAVITGAMFGATQSTEQFFLTMAKNIIATLVEDLLKRGILALLSSLIPGAAFIGPLLADGSTGGNRTATSRVPTEEFSGGQSVNLTINVNGDTRNMSVRDKRAALDVVEEIIMLDNR